MAGISRTVIKEQGQRKVWHMPPSRKLSVGVWKIRFREKCYMVKIDEPQ
jgi:hypothetical protein